MLQTELGSHKKSKLNQPEKEGQYGEKGDEELDIHDPATVPSKPVHARGPLKAVSAFGPVGGCPPSRPSMVQAFPCSAHGKGRRMLDRVQRKAFTMAGPNFTRAAAAPKETPAKSTTYSVRMAPVVSRRRLRSESAFEAWSREVSDAGCMEPPSPSVTHAGVHGHLTESSFNTHAIRQKPTPARM
jgi:hypothetical protein